jgi:phosphatidylinositol alpha-1,6-mannosyltransferase
MRLLLLTIDFPPARGGVQGLLGRLAAELAGTWEVTVITPAAPADAAWDARQPFTVLRSWPGRRRVLALAGLHVRALVAILWRRPQVIVCGHVLLGPLCRLVSLALRVPYVAMTYAYEIRAPRLRVLARLTLSGARRVIALSEFGRQAAQAHGIAPASISVLRPGPALDDVTGGATEVDLPGARVVLSVGRLVDAYKGHDMVIRALPLILASEPAACYVVIGEGPLRPYLERLAASLGVAHAVRFLGELPDAEVDRWYARCDVFVLAGRESAASGGAEGYGLVLVEASLRGKPVVGGRSGGIPDAVVDGETGVLVDPLEPGEIAEAIGRLLGDPALATRLGRAGRRRVLDELGWPRYTERFASLLAQVSAG